MSYLSHLVFTDIRVNIKDPQTLLAILQNFRRETTVLLVRVAVVQPALARMLRKIAVEIAYFMETRFIIIMETDQILGVYFTNQVRDLDIGLYDEVSEEILAGLDMFVRFPRYNEQELRQTYEQALNAAADPRVKQAEEQMLLKGCLDPSHIVFMSEDSIATTTCSSGLCSGNFALPNIPTLRHILDGVSVLPRSDEKWLATEHNRLKDFRKRVSECPCCELGCAQKNERHLEKGDILLEDDEEMPDLTDPDEI